MRECGTPEPGEDFEAMLERRQADGTMSVDDADGVRGFADFLRAAGPIGEKGEEARSRRRRALIDHAEFVGLSDADVERLREAEANADKALGGGGA